MKFQICRRLKLLLLCNKSNEREREKERESESTTREVRVKCKIGNGARFQRESRQMAGYYIRMRETGGSEGIEKLEQLGEKGEELGGINKQNFQWRNAMILAGSREKETKISGRGRDREIRRTRKRVTVGGLKKLRGTFSNNR